MVIGIFSNRPSCSIWRIYNRRNQTDGTQRYHGTVILWDQYQNNVGPIALICLRKLYKTSVVRPNQVHAS
jgi:hypothetical protein